jgi:hypothetical protein
VGARIDRKGAPTDLQILHGAKKKFALFCDFFVFISFLISYLRQKPSAHKCHFKTFEWRLNPLSCCAFPRFGYAEAGNIEGTWFECDRKLELICKSFPQIEGFFEAAKKAASGVDSMVPLLSFAVDSPSCTSIMKAALGFSPPFLVPSAQRSGCAASLPARRWSQP